MKNLNDDLLDDGLQAVMGPDRCQNDWQPKSQSREAVTAAEQKKGSKRGEAVDAAWVSVPGAGTDLRKVMECAKQTALYGGLSAVLFWWQQAGLLASEAAVPSFILLALLAGLRIGSICRE